MEPIKNAFADIKVSDARGLYSTIFEQDEPTRNKNLQLHRQLEGGKPYNQADLDAEGQGHRANHNFRDGEADRNRAAQPYWEMVNAQARVASVEIQAKTNLKEDYEHAFMQCFDDFIEDWGIDYIVTQEMTTRDFVDFGKTLVTWLDDSPRYKHHRIENIAFPARTPLSPSDWNLFYIRDELGFETLWKLVKTKTDESQAAAKGWDIDMVKSVLHHAVTKGKDENGITPGTLINRDSDQWDDIRSEILNNELSTSYEHPAIAVISLIKKEDDGKISVRILLENELVNKNDTDDELMDDFLYSNTDIAPSFEDMAGVNYWEVANGQIAGVKGFAERNFNYIVMLNRLKCTLVDSLDLSAALNFKRIGEISDDEPVIENYGNINVVSPSLEAVNFFPNTDASLKVLQQLSADQSTTNAQYKDQSNQIADTQTAKQAQILAAMNAETSRANAALYLSYFGKWLDNCMMKLRKRGSTDPDAKRFVERMQALAVPDNIIHDVDIRVRSAGSASAASPAAREATFGKLMGLRGAPGVDSNAILRDFVANEVGPRKVNTYVPQNPQTAIASAQGYATIENGTMANGIPLPVAETQDHVVHLQTHMQVLTGIVQKFQQSGQVDGAQTVAANFIDPHIQEHLQFLSQDEILEDQFKAISKQYNEIQNIIRQMLNQAQQEQQAQTQQNV